MYKLYCFHQPNKLKHSTAETLQKYRNKKQNRQRKLLPTFHLKSKFPKTLRLQKLKKILKCDAKKLQNTNMHI